MLNNYLFYAFLGGKRAGGVFEECWIFSSLNEYGNDKPSHFASTKIESVLASTILHYCSFFFIQTHIKIARSCLTKINGGTKTSLIFFITCLAIRPLNLSFWWQLRICVMYILQVYKFRFIERIDLIEEVKLYIFLSHFLYD